MPHDSTEPCRSCDQREVDWGGCRCQALAMTGDAGATDPACALSGRPPPRPSACALSSLTKSPALILARAGIIATAATTTAVIAATAATAATATLLLLHGLLLQHLLRGL